MSESIINDLEKLRDSYLKKAEALSISIDIIKEETAKTQPLVPKSESRTEVIGEPSANAYTARVLSVIDKTGRFVKKSTLDKELIDLTSDTIRYTITYLKKKGVLISVKANANNANTFWGRKTWMENNSPKREFMYKDNEVIRK